MIDKIFQFFSALPTLSPSDYLIRGSEEGEEERAKEMLAFWRKYWALRVQECFGSFFGTLAWALVKIREHSWALQCIPQELFWSSLGVLSQAFFFIASFLSVSKNSLSDRSVWAWNLRGAFAILRESIIARYRARNGAAHATHVQKLFVWESYAVCSFWARSVS